VRDHDLQSRRLRDHADVGAVPGLDQREGAGTPVLLPRYESQYGLPDESGAIRRESTHRFDGCHETTFHVACPAPEHLAVTNRRLEGRRRPGFRLSRRDHVHVGVEEDRGPVSPGVELRHDEREPVVFHLGSGEAGIG
jgi:hypothetical protein